MFGLFEKLTLVYFSLLSVNIYLFNRNICYRYLKTIYTVIILTKAANLVKLLLCFEFCSEFLFCQIFSFYLNDTDVMRSQCSQGLRSIYGQYKFSETHCIPMHSSKKKEDTQFVKLHYINNQSPVSV